MGRLIWGRPEVGTHSDSQAKGPLGGRLRSANVRSLWSRRGESNPWPFDYESNALPTELPGG